jgi:alkylhydroperoxidase/carboxymuconolactone decarboxylase family protein YurZ
MPSDPSTAAERQPPREGPTRTSPPSSTRHPGGPRSLITVATLVAQYRTNEMPFHMKRALENGVTRDELVELITHLAFYAGWPPASTAVGIARQVFADTAR